VSTTATTYLIAAVAGVASLTLWIWLIAAPAFTAYNRWWQRALSVVLSVYVLAAFVAAGGLIAAIFLWYYDRIA
jgi:hypothetical protein